MKAEFEFLVKLTQSNSLEVRLAAIDAIAKTRQHKAFVIDTLSHIIKFNSEQEKKAAIKALGELGGRAAMNVLIDEIKTPTNSSIKTLAIMALGEAFKNTDMNELVENVIDREQKLQLVVL